MNANTLCTNQDNLAISNRRQLNWLFLGVLAAIGSPASNPVQLSALAQVVPRLSVPGPSYSRVVGVNSAVRRHDGGGGDVWFLLAGAPDKNYLIQASTDLTTWVTVATNRTSSDGTALFTDPEASQFSGRFYRAGSPDGETPAALGFRRDRVLVRPKPGITLSVPNLLPGASVLQTLPDIGQLQVVQLSAGQSVEEAVTDLRQSDQVEYAEPDYVVKLMATPNDFRFGDGSLWGLHNAGQGGGTADADIDAPEAWEIQNSAENIIVAVIDTGVRYTHEDLAANMWVNSGEIAGNSIDDDGNGFVDDVFGVNVINNSGDPNDDHGHGTHVSGIVGAVGNNQVGVVGVAWKVKIMGCKFLDPTGNGYVSDAIKCIDYARSKGARIMNVSWGSTTFTSAALRDAFDSARQAGIIVTAAAGNSAGNNDVDPLYPASYELDNIIAVAATTRTDEMATFSNYGATTVDLAAPGSPVFSCWNGSDSDYRYLEGTSMAAPHVAGVCALLEARYPGETYQQIINRLLSNTDPLPVLAGKCVTGGRLNFQKALGGAAPPPKPAVTVGATDAAAAEAGVDAGTFTISRSGPSAAALTVQYTLGGTAANGTDYNSLSGSVTIAAGASSATVTVTPIDDTAVEGSETAVLTITSDATYDIGSPGNATVTIADNDQPPPQRPTVTVGASDANAAEANLNTGVFTISRSGSTAAGLAVQYILGGTGANGSDYDSLPGSLTIPAGAASATVTVTPIDDSSVESAETAVLVIASDAAYDVGSPNNATVTIADNDQAPPQKPTVTVGATDANAAEANRDTGILTINRTGSTAASLTVKYSLNGTASNGTDYDSLSGSVTIAAGASSATVTVRPIDDTAVEISETAGLVIASDAAYDIGSTGSATITIADNDQPSGTRPIVTVVASDPTAEESGDTGTFTISRAGSTATAVTVRYSLGGHAQNGADYETLSDEVTIPAGAASVAVTVSPIEDSGVEIDEPVYLMLYGWTEAPYIVGNPDAATVTIMGNDQLPSRPTITVVASDPNAAESGDRATFTISRTGSTSAAVTVQYSLGGNAQNGTDYQTLSESVTIPAGAASVAVTVIPIEDSSNEIDEPLYLMLYGWTGAPYIVGNPDAATVIIDND